MSDEIKMLPFEGQDVPDFRELHKKIAESMEKEQRELGQAIAQTEDRWLRWVIRGQVMNKKKYRMAYTKAKLGIADDLLMLMAENGLRVDRIEDSREMAAAIDKGVIRREIRVTKHDKTVVHKVWEWELDGDSKGEA